MKKHILVIEDDIAMAKGLQNELSAAGYDVTLAEDARMALDVLSAHRIDLVLLDVNLPGENGFAFSEKLRKQWDGPFIFLTARDLECDEARGFDLGADDYITKPFSPIVLLKRIDAVLRRVSKGNALFYDDGCLIIDFGAATVTQDGVVAALTPIECKLLAKLAQNPGRVLTRGVLLGAIWDIEENFVDEHALTVNMGRLRKKIEPTHEKYIKTVYGMGYMWMGENL